MFQNARNHISENLKFQNFPEEQLQTELPRREFYFICLLSSEHTSVFSFFYKIANCH